MPTYDFCASALPDHRSCPRLASSRGHSFGHYQFSNRPHAAGRTSHMFGVALATFPWQHTLPADDCNLPSRWHSRRWTLIVSSITSAILIAIHVQERESWTSSSKYAALNTRNSTPNQTATGTLWKCFIGTACFILQRQPALQLDSCSTL